MRLSDQVIIVTGAARGIGLAYAQRLAAEGAAVVIADLEVGGSEALTATTSRAMFVPTDIADGRDTQRLVDQTLRRYNKIDGLVNNAALFTGLKRQSFEELTDEDWDKVLRVNVVGTFNCIKAVIGPMKARKRGKIINIASNVVHKGLPFLLHYVASKGAVIAMTRSLARELGPHGINVNAIAPGYVLHDRTAVTDSGRNEQVSKLRALARTETPEDLCGAVVFLASSDSDFISGQTLVVDGGEVFS